MADFGKLAWGPARDGEGEPVVYALNDADDAAASVMHAPYTGNITHVGFYVSAKTGTPPGYQAGVCVVSETTGAPSSTPLAGSAFGAVSTASTGWQWVELGTAAAVDRGDLLGIYVGPTGAPGAPDLSNCITVALAHTRVQSFPAEWTFGAIWAIAKVAPAMMVKYADGLVAGVPILPNHYAAGDVADTPDEVGAKFTLPYAMRVYGASLVLAAVGANASYQVVLYDASSNALGTITVVDEDIHDQAGFIRELIFPSSIALTADTTYRLVLKATHASATVQVANFLWPDATMRSTYHQGANWVLTARTDGGTWTDSDGTAVMALLVDDITLPGGSSGPRWL